MPPPSGGGTIPGKNAGNTSTVHKGRRGEERAARYLSSHRYRILEKNFKSVAGEVDIVAVRGRLIVFAEVKAWSRFRDYDLERALARWKRRRIVASSRIYLARHGGFRGYTVRYDVLLIPGDDRPPRHIEGAFGDVWCE